MIKYSLPDKYFDALGEPKPSQAFGLLDDFRFSLVYRHLSPGSVLDVGAYFGDFLRLARDDGREIFGTEVNDVRLNLANKIVGKDVVVMDFRNGRLRKFSDNSVNNVVAMEVIEHVPDDRLAVSELCRVGRIRVMITVPLREQIQTVLCIHCNKYTPHSGHLHSYDLGTIAGLASENWRVTKQLPIAKPLTRLVASRLPKSKLALPMLRLVDLISPGLGKWLLVVIDRCHSLNLDGSSVRAMGD